MRNRRSATEAYTSILTADEHEIARFWQEVQGERTFNNVAFDFLRPGPFIVRHGFEEWNEVFPNATCIATLLDRLLHHADATVIEGESYRMRESEQEAATRRRKK